MSFNAMLTVTSPPAFNGTLQRCICPQITPRVSSSECTLEALGVQEIFIMVQPNIVRTFHSAKRPGLQVVGARHTVGRRGPLAIVARLGTPKRGADIVKTQADLREERREQLGDGNIWEAVVESHQRLAQDVDIKKLLGTAFVIGVTFGTAFQPTHNNGFLPVSYAAAAVWGDLSTTVHMHVFLCMCYPVPLLDLRPAINTQNIL